jgi:HlyD family secretion protein
LNQKPNIFRQESLERLASPERLDQLMQVVAPRDWLFLVALGAIVVGAVSWSIWGRIPVTVQGRGVLVYPDRTTELQSPIAGRLATLRVQPGDRVQPGQVIGSIARADLQQALQQEQLKLRRLQQQDEQLVTATKGQTRTTLQALQQKEQTIQKTLQDKQALVIPIRTNEQRTLQQQRQVLEQTLQAKQAIAPVLQQQLQNRQKLLDEGAISTDLLLQSAQAYQANQQDIVTLKSQLQDLNRQALTIEQTYRATLRQIDELHAQRQEIQTQKQQLSQRSLEAEIQRNNQIQEIKQHIARLSLQLQQSSQITSETRGRILELTAKPGQVLNPGDRLGVVQVEGGTPQLVTVAYFSIKDGKRIQPGMAVQITPDSVPRERFGGLVGTVKSVSDQPVSHQAMASTVGNREVAESLIVPGGQIAVVAAMQRDPTTVSGYQWSSSRGPALEISPGTTATVRTTIEQQAPITFVLPIFKSFTNLY